MTLKWNYRRNVYRSSSMASINFSKGLAFQCFGGITLSENRMIDMYILGIRRFRQWVLFGCYQLHLHCSKTVNWLLNPYLWVWGNDPKWSLLEEKKSPCSVINIHKDGFQLTESYWLWLLVSAALEKWLRTFRRRDLLWIYYFYQSANFLVIVLLVIPPPSPPPPFFWYY